MTARGFNPMRWNCERQGCWNKLNRFKIELFAECFYGASSMGDIDGGVDQYGCFLFVEFKKYKGAMPYGQELFWRRLTQLSDKITLFVVEADPETSTIYSISTMVNGEQSEWADCDLVGLRAKMIEWREGASARQRKEIERRAKP